ncbi:MAG TPA: MaoC family dehydratase [Rhizomicrobium sp.]|jgi:acyl dehydratase|nr:MaoC family dehydratase [Rhizomicrobium sp.]
MTENSSGTARKPQYLEDFFVGQRFSGGSYVMTAERIRAYAAEFDPQPFHLDDEAARSSLFGGLAASGWHTAAVTMRLNVEGGLPLAGGIIGAGADVAWPRPTRPGDTLRVESEVLEVIPSRSRADRGRVIVMTRTFNQNDEVVQTLKSRLVVFRRPTA